MGKSLSEQLSLGGFCGVIKQTAFETTNFTLSHRRQVSARSEMLTACSVKLPSRLDNDRKRKRAHENRHQLRIAQYVITLVYCSTF